MRGACRTRIIRAKRGGVEDPLIYNQTLSAGIGGCDTSAGVRTTKVDNQEALFPVGGVDEGHDLEAHRLKSHVCELISHRRLSLDAKGTAGVKLPGLRGRRECWKREGNERRGVGSGMNRPGRQLNDIQHLDVMMQDIERWKGCCRWASWGGSGT